MDIQESSATELILIRITGEDRPGLTASVMEILAKYDATILDIGQADIHSIAPSPWASCARRRNNTPASS